MGGFIILTISTAKDLRGRVEAKWREMERGQIIMMRKLTVGLVLVIGLLAVRPASAIPVNLDTWLPTAGELFAGPTSDDFNVAEAPPPTMGNLVSNVYFDGTQYTYVHTVTPGLNNNFVLDTAFDVAGYTGVAGWSFSDADAAGGDRERLRLHAVRGGADGLGVVDRTALQRSAGMRMSRSRSSSCPPNRQASVTTTSSALNPAPQTVSRRSRSLARSRCSVQGW